MKTCLLDQTTDVPFPKIRASYKRKSAFERLSGVRKAETDTHAQRRDRIIPFDDLPEYILKRNSPFALSQGPLIESHQRRLDGIIAPRGAKPQVNLAVTPESLLRPWKG